MKPEGLLLLSQEPATGHHTERNECSPYLRATFPSNSFERCPPMYALIIYVVSPHPTFRQMFCVHS
jgi:hypothetical protein